MDLTGLGSLADFAGKVLDRVIPDPTQKAAAALELAKMQQSGDLAKLASDTDLAKAQMAINEKEAASPNMFIAGPRPFVMWVCGLALLYAAILEPVARFVATVIYKYNGGFPIIDTALTLQILLGLLGLGGYRTWEKIKNAEGNR